MHVANVAQSYVLLAITNMQCKKKTFVFPSLQFQFKEIVLSEEEKRLLAKEGVTIPTHMPLTKVIVLLLSSIVSCSRLDHLPNTVTVNVVKSLI